MNGRETGKSYNKRPADQGVRVLRLILNRWHTELVPCLHYATGYATHIDLTRQKLIAKHCLTSRKGVFQDGVLLEIFPQELLALTTRIRKMIPCISWSYLELW